MIPTYNEAETVLSTIAEIRWVMGPVHILVVDDSSPDGTGGLIKKAQQTDDALFLLSRPQKEGLAAAYRAAVRWGLGRCYDLFVQFDADGSHDPAYLPALIEASSEADLVVGSRLAPGGGAVGWSFWRHLLSRLGNRYSRSLLGGTVRDLTGGFNCISRRVLETGVLGEIDATGYGFQIAFKFHCIRAGWRVVEVPIVFRKRRAGVSKMGGAIIAEALLFVWRLSGEQETR